MTNNQYFVTFGGFGKKKDEDQWPKNPLYTHILTSRHSIAVFGLIPFTKIHPIWAWEHPDRDRGNHAPSIAPTSA
jgi:hypothetical protein